MPPTRRYPIKEAKPPNNHNNHNNHNKKKSVTWADGSKQEGLGGLGLGGGGGGGGNNVNVKYTGPIGKYHPRVMRSLDRYVR